MKLHLFVSLAATLLLAGCGGGADGTAEPTATAMSTPTAMLASPTPGLPASRVAVPSPPAGIVDYPQTIADYLTAAGAEAIGPPCLAELLEAWDMPETGDESRCLVANTDDDAEDEIVVILSATTHDPDSPQFTIVRSSVVVLDYRDNRYQVAFQSQAGERPSRFEPSAEAIVVAAGDINNDGNGELVYADSDCGAHTCYQTVHIVSGRADGYRSLSGEGFTMAYPDISLNDVEGDGAQGLVMYGGIIASVGAGPQRERTEVYAWDGARYVLASTTYDETNFLCLRIFDADDVFAEERYQDAVGLYRDALNNRGLTLWREMSGWGENERAEMDPYLRFRIALSLLATGAAPEEAIGELEQAAFDYPGSRHAEMAQAFLDSYLAKGNVSIACEAARSYATANLDEFRAIWDYGYANPDFEPNQVCPF